MVEHITQVSELEELLVQGGAILTPYEETGTTETVDLGGERFDVQAQVQNRAEKWLVLYNTMTNEPVSVDVNRALVLLRKQFPDTQAMRAEAPQFIGRRAFTLGVRDGSGRFVAPGPYHIGEMSCLLNPDHPDNDYYRSLGLNTRCPAKHRPNVMQVETHMRSKHPREWDMIQRAETDRRRDENENRQNALILAAVQGKVPNDLLRKLFGNEEYEEEYEEDEIEYGFDFDEVEEEQSSPAYTKVCEEEGCDFVSEASTAGLAAINLGKHMKQAHPDGR